MTITKKASEEETPSEDEPTLELPDDITMSIAAGTAELTAVAKVKAPATLDKMIVQIIPGCDAFVEALELAKNANLDFITTGVDLVAQADDVNYLFTLVGHPEVVAPTTDTTDYEFAIDTFFRFIMEPTDEGTPHQFKITVIDDNGKSVEGGFKLTVTE